MYTEEITVTVNACLYCYNRPAKGGIGRWKDHCHRCMQYEKRTGKHWTPEVKKFDGEALGKIGRKKMLHNRDDIKLIQYNAALKTTRNKLERSSLRSKMSTLALAHCRECLKLNEGDNV